MRFVKMEGAGNDYVYVDCFLGALPDAPEAVAIEVSRPHFGIGSDGLILIEPSDVADGRMRVFNADGSEALMCGNGLRCVSKHLYDAGHVKDTHIRVETASGVKAVELLMDGGRCTGARASMGPPAFSGESLGARFDSAEWVERPICVLGREYVMTCVSMGNPHAVLFVDELPGDDEFQAVGRALETHSMFLARANVEFVKVVSNTELHVRVWERGSGETLACGTGACASLVAAARGNRSGRAARVLLKGGTLEIEWREDNEVLMAGPARTVFIGEYFYGER